MKNDLKKFLDQKVIQFNNPSFIKDDPVSIPHLFSKKEDIEIAGFFAAIFAWGIRKTIINKSKLLLQLMDNAPYDFCLHHSDTDLRNVERFCHRTFNDTDLLYFISFFKFHYSKHLSLEVAFFNNKTIKQFDNVVENSLNYFYEYFFLSKMYLQEQKNILLRHKKIQLASASICICGGWFAMMIKELILESGKKFHLHN